MIPSTDFIDGRCSIFDDIMAKQFSVQEKRLIVLKYGACLRCGLVGHVARDCGRKDVHGSPCFKCPSHSDGKWGHNEKLHVSNYVKFRQMFLKFRMSRLIQYIISGMEEETERPQMMS